MVAQYAKLLSMSTASHMGLCWSPSCPISDALPVDSWESRGSSPNSLGFCTHVEETDTAFASCLQIASAPTVASIWESEPANVRSFFISPSLSVTALPIKIIDSFLKKFQPFYTHTRTYTYIHIYIYKLCLILNLK